MPSLYILKFICCFFVVTIHSSLFCKDALAPIIWSAVPCFYLCSGYFLYGGASKKTESAKVKRWVTKTIILLAALNLMYFSVKLLLFNQHIPWHMLLISIVEGGIISTPLWYLSSLWEGLLIVWLMLQISRRLLILGAVSYIIVYTLNQLYFHIPTGLYCNWEEHAMSVSRSVCFLSIGYMMAWFNFKNRYKIRWDIIIFILSFIALKTHVAEYAPLNYFFIVTVSCSLFAIALKADKLRSKWMEYIGKYHSANIYYFHAFILLIYSFLSFRYPCLKLNNNTAIPIFIMSLALSWGINAVMKNMKKFLLTTKRIGGESEKNN